MLQQWNWMLWWLISNFCVRHFQRDVGSFAQRWCNGCMRVQHVHVQLWLYIWQRYKFNHSLVINILDITRWFNWIFLTDTWCRITILYPLNYIWNIPSIQDYKPHSNAGALCLRRSCHAEHSLGQLQRCATAVVSYRPVEANCYMLNPADRRKYGQQPTRMLRMLQPNKFYVPDLERKHFLTFLQ